MDFILDCEIVVPLNFPISELISSLDYEGHSNRLKERSEFLKQIMYIYQQELWGSNNKAINYLKQRGFTTWHGPKWNGVRLMRDPLVRHANRNKTKQFGR